jgi:hypothetical protein
MIASIVGRIKSNRLIVCSSQVFQPHTYTYPDLEIFAILKHGMFGFVEMDMLGRNSTI